MSVAAKLSSKDVKRWLENQTDSMFVPVHNKARKLVDEMRKALADLQELSKMLLDNSAKEVEKRNEKTFRRARALNRLARLFLERVQRVNVPETVTYDSVSHLVQETQKVVFVIDVDIQNWFPRISPFFIMDRRKFQVIFEKTKSALKELNGFLTKEYVKTKTLEETFQLGDKLLALEQEAASFKEKKVKAENEQGTLGSEIFAATQEGAALKSKGGLSQLAQTETEIEALNVELRNGLQHLQKPFIKLQALAVHGGGSGLMKDEAVKLDQYLASPLEAFATEQAGYPVLKAILEKLDNSMSDKLNLKPEKERKAKQAIDAILRGNSLASLQLRCSDALTRREQLLASAEVTATQTELARLNERTEALERRKKIAESEATVADRGYRETLDKIRAAKSSIEKNVFDFTTQKIVVE